MKRGNLVFGMRFKMARWNFSFFPPPPQIQRHGWITHVRRVSRIFFVWKDGWREGWKEFLIPRPENSAISRISNFLSVGSRVYRAGLHFNILKSYTVWTFSFFFFWSRFSTKERYELNIWILGINKIRLILRISTCIPSTLERRKSWSNNLLSKSTVDI